MAHYSKLVFVYGNWTSTDKQSAEMDVLAAKYNGKHTGGMRGCYGTIDFKTKKEAEDAVHAINNGRKFTAIGAFDRSVKMHQEMYDGMVARNGADYANEKMDMFAKSTYPGVGALIKRVK